MKKVIILTMLCVIPSLTTLAQTFYPISVEKKGFAKHYIQNGERLDGKEIRSVLSGYSGSAGEFKKSSRNSGIGVGLLAGGCLVIGASSLISTLKDVETLNSGSLDVSGANTGPFLVGCGMALAGIPFLLKGNAQFVRSVNLYNAQSSAGAVSGPSMTIAFSPAGAAIKIVF